MLHLRRSTNRSSSITREEGTALAEIDLLHAAELSLGEEGQRPTAHPPRDVPEWSPSRIASWQASTETRSYGAPYALRRGQAPASACGVSASYYSRSRPSLEVVL